MQSGQDSGGGCFGISLQHEFPIVYRDNIYILFFQILQQILISLHESNFSNQYLIKTHLADYFINAIPKIYNHSLFFSNLSISSSPFIYSFLQIIPILSMTSFHHINKINIQVFMSELIELQQSQTKNSRTSRQKQTGNTLRISYENNLTTIHYYHVNEQSVYQQIYSCSEMPQFLQKIAQSPSEVYQIIQKSWQDNKCKICQDNQFYLEIISYLAFKDVKWRFPLFKRDLTSDEKIQIMKAQIEEISQKSNKEINQLRSQNHKKDNILRKMGDELEKLQLQNKKLEEQVSILSKTNLELQISYQKLKNQKDQNKLNKYHNHNHNNQYNNNSNYHSHKKWRNFEEKSDKELMNYARNRDHGQTKYDDLRNNYFHNEGMRSPQESNESLRTKEQRMGSDSQTIIIKPDSDADQQKEAKKDKFNWNQLYLHHQHRFPKQRNNNLQRKNKEY